DFTVERPVGNWRRQFAHLPIPTELLILLESCWDDDPCRRPQDALSLAESLEHLRASRHSGNSQEFSGPPTPPPYAQRQKSRVHKTLAAPYIALAAMVLIGLVSVPLILIAIHSASGPRESQHAQNAG